MSCILPFLAPDHMPFLQIQILSETQLDLTVYDRTISPFGQYTNSFFFLVSSRFGFGLMDAGLMTWHASGWKNVPPMSTCESITSNPKRVITAHSSQTFTLKLVECRDNGEPSREVNYIEQVQAYVTLSTDRRGEIEIYLHSPSNTRSQLLPVR